MILTQNNISKLIVLIALILLPGSIYIYFIARLKNVPKLPYLGPKEPIERVEKGQTIIDTIYHEVSPFSFVGHNGNEVTLHTMGDKICVVDFFFTSCQGICPLMSSQLERVQEHYSNFDDLLLLSHTVDPESDSISVLNSYAKEHNAKEDKWLFLTGSKIELYEMARKSYFVSASEGNGGEEDFIHSERFILIDKEKRLRGHYDGTDSVEVDRLIDDIAILIGEYQLVLK
jgi:protein SCO1/2